MMKKNVLLASSMLASVLVLNTQATSAMEMLPYSSNANSYAQGSSHSDGPNAGPSSSSSRGPMTNSFSSVNDYSLHASSTVYDYYAIPAVPAIDSIKKPEVKEMSISTSASASFEQVFTVLNSGNATLNFAWDGLLFSNGDYNSGYSFSANATMSGDEQIKGFHLGSFGNNQSINGGSVSIDLFDSIELSFSGNDIGKTFSVRASLNTHVNERFNNIVDDEVFANLATITSESAPVSDGPSAYSDFSNTAIFSFTGQGVIAPAAVPVPAAVWLFGSALLGLVGTRRKKAA